MELEKGKLYQVRSNKQWLIAEYVSVVPAHTAKGYRSTDGATSWPEPEAHFWKSVPGKQPFRVRSKGLSVRDVTPETLTEIERLQTKVDNLYNERIAVIRELRELCS